MKRLQQWSGELQWKGSGYPSADRTVIPTPGFANAKYVQLARYSGDARPLGLDLFPSAPTLGSGGFTDVASTLNLVCGAPATPDQLELQAGWLVQYGSGNVRQVRWFDLDSLRLCIPWAEYCEVGVFWWGVNGVGPGPFVMSDDALIKAAITPLENPFEGDTPHATTIFDLEPGTSADVYIAPGTYAIDFGMMQNNGFGAAQAILQTDPAFAVVRGLGAMIRNYVTGQFVPGGPQAVGGMAQNEFITLQNVGGGAGPPPFHSACFTCWISL